MAYGFIDFAKEVLEASGSPLSVEKMWEAGCKLGFAGKLGSSGKTPIRTLSARIYVDLKINPESVFMQISKRPAKFFLKGKDFTSNPEELQETDGSREMGKIQRGRFCLPSWHPLHSRKVNPYRRMSKWASNFDTSRALCRSIITDF